MSTLRPVNKSKLGLVNGTIGTVSDEDTQQPELTLDEEVIDN